jgi:hypothetical protein
VGTGPNWDTHMFTGPNFPPIERVSGTPDLKLKLTIDPGLTIALI